MNIRTASQLKIGDRVIFTGDGAHGAVIATDYFRFTVEWEDGRVQTLLYDKAAQVERDPHVLA